MWLGRTTGWRRSAERGGTVMQQILAGGREWGPEALWRGTARGEGGFGIGVGGTVVGEQRVLHRVCGVAVGYKACESAALAEGAV